MQDATDTAVLERRAEHSRAPVWCCGVLRETCQRLGGWKDSGELLGVVVEEENLFGLNLGVSTFLKKHPGVFQPILSPI